MVFRVRETLTEEDRKAWRRASDRREKLARSGYGLFLGLWLAMKLLGMFLAGCGAVVLYWTGAEDPGVIKGVLQAIIALYLIGGGGWLLLTLPRPPKRPGKKLPDRDFPPSGMPDIPVRAVFFGDGCFALWEGPGKVRLGYSSISAYWEDEGRFYLFFEDRTPLVLPKRGLAGGTAEEFRDFLEREFGWPVERIK